MKCGLIPETIFQGRHAQNNINFLHAIQNINGIGSFILIAIPTLLGICWWFYQRKYTLSNRFLYAIVALTMGMYIALDGAYQPPILNSKSVKSVAAEIDRVVPASAGTLYEFIEAGVRSIGDPVHYFEINFYLGNRIGNFYKDRPSEGFLLIGMQDAERNLPEFEKEATSSNGSINHPNPFFARLPRYTNSQKVVSDEFTVFPCFTRYSADWSMEKLYSFKGRKLSSIGT